MRAMKRDIQRMGKCYKIVDLFAGPGGLAEGFSAYRVNGNQVFDVRLSVEKEASAFATLRLRAFVRRFDGDLPGEYYDYIAGRIDRRQLIEAYPEEWLAACAETQQLELGTDNAKEILNPILDQMSENDDSEIVLIGGPPCQAYSLVGRARNLGIADYDANNDPRHFLYREYIDIVARLKPAAFVMENVKGILSSRIEGERIFSRVLEDLRAVGGEPGSYEIIPLTASKGRNGTEYVLRSEDFGIPQKRHRVILFGVRRDLAPGLFRQVQALEPNSCVNLVDVLGAMPRLRSGLSRQEDSSEAWKTSVVAAFERAAVAAYEEEDENLDHVALRLSEYAKKLQTHCPPPRLAVSLAPVANNELSEWLIDPRLQELPNHEARTHMATDLSRYAFAATFAEVTGKSPKAADFPKDLAPAHQNWGSGKFNDRFRVQLWNEPATTVTSHISKDGHYFIHPDPLQCRSLSVREAARLQTFPDNYFFEGNRTQQYVQVGNAVPPLLARQIAAVVHTLLASHAHQAPDRQ